MEKIKFNKSIDDTKDVLNEKIELYNLYKDTINRDTLSYMLSLDIEGIFAFNSVNKEINKLRSLQIDLGKLNTNEANYFYNEVKALLEYLDETKEFYIEKDNIFFQLNVFTENCCLENDDILNYGRLGFFSDSKLIESEKKDDVCYITIDRFCSFFKNTILSKEKLNQKILTYLMTDSSGLIKIGKTNNVYKRLKTFEIGNPTIKILFVINENIESKLHKEFSKKRVKGEWFSLSDIDVLNIKKLI